VRFELRGNVAVITLDAPARRNALVPSMVAEFVDACAAADGNPDVGAVVICGAGESFCSGAHRDVLDGIAQDPAGTASYQGLSEMYRAFTRLSEVLVPSIAAVRGHAVGAGVNMMLAADLRIIAHEARVISGFGAIGLHPGGGHFSLLGRVGTRDAAAAVGLFGQQVTGRRAAEVGLAWESLPADDVEPRAMEIAARVARDPELARASARSFRAELGPPALAWANALDIEKGVQMWSLRRRHQASQGGDPS
jgi:enoyl-CoA hydratase